MCIPDNASKSPHYSSHSDAFSSSKKYLSKHFIHFLNSSDMEIDNLQLILGQAWLWKNMQYTRDKTQQSGESYSLRKSQLTYHISCTNNRHNNKETQISRWFYLLISTFSCILIACTNRVLLLCFSIAIRFTTSIKYLDLAFDALIVWEIPCNQILSQKMKYYVLRAFINCCWFLIPRHNRDKAFCT